MSKEQATKVYKFIKDGQIKFDGGHDVYTPQALVDEILSKVKLDGDILVLFNVEFVISLVYTYGIDASKITFYSDHLNKVKLLQKLGATKETKYLDTLDTNMKFDVVIGNPPYQEGDTGTNKTLFDKFYYKLTPLCNDTMVLIAPTVWLMTNKKSLQTLREYLHMHGLYAVDLIDSQRVFGVNVDSLGVTYQHINQPSKAYDITTLDGSVITLPTDGRPAVLTNNSVALQALEKITSLDTLQAFNTNLRGVGRDGTCSNGEASTISSAQHPYRMANKVAGGVVEYAHTRINKNPHSNAHRVCFGQLTSAKSLGPVTIINDPNVTTSRSVVYIPCGSIIEAKNCAQFLASKVFLFALRHKRTNTLNAIGMLKELPAVDFARSWTDAELYAHFNLTQDEIDLIEATVK